MSVVASLIALLNFHDQPFAIFHVRQGFALFVVWFLSLIVLSFSVLFGLLFWLVLFVFSCRAGYRAWKGQEYAFPGLRSLSQLMPIETIYRHLMAENLPRS